MRPARLVCLAVAALTSAACNCGHKLVDVTETCETDSTLCPVAQPAPNSPTKPGIRVPETGTCTTQTGSITGRVCAPDQHTWVNGAKITVTAKDCSGADITLDATSAADGTFTLDEVPVGHWTIHATLGSFSQDTPVFVNASATTAIPDNDLCVAQGTVKIAVVSGAGDQIEDLLQGLSLQYTLIPGDTTSNWSAHAEPFLLNLAQMKTYDIIFFDCAAAKASNSIIDLGSQGGQIHQNLKDYVAQGGSVYASDWALVFPYYAAPGALDFLTNGGQAVSTPFATKYLMGYAPQTVSATVADPDLATFLGKSTVSIDFPKQSGASSLHWGLMQNVGPGAQVLVQAATVQACETMDTGCTSAGMTVTSIPLAVQMKMTPSDQHGGRVVYTSFHNIAQSGSDVAQILKYLVLHL